MHSAITGLTGLTALLGSPVSHSISPAMHNESFHILGLDYTYLAFDVNEQTFHTAINGLKALNIKGFNCTMPLKRLMHDACDELSATARIAGAVNTVLHENGKFIGHNTDGYGFMQSVRDIGWDLTNKEITILGSGGAASAIMAQAALDGISQIHIFSRPESSSTQCLKDVALRIDDSTTCQTHFHNLTDYSSLHKCTSKSALLVNTSSVGMTPNIDGCLIPDASYFHPELLVADAIYEPRETKLLAMAREAGYATMNGMYMLLHQGAKAFEIWTGKQMPVEEIRRKYFV